MSSVSSHPRSVEEIRRDYGARRKGILRALTTDVDELYALCDPEKENLCLYGYPNGGWEVAPPAEEVPPEMPEPALGINFARDGMRRREWLSLIAIHSDAWLLSVAFFFGTLLNRSERKRLFTMINEVPTIYEVLSEKDKAPVDGGSKTKSSKRSAEGQLKSNFESQLRNNPKPSEEAYAEEDEEHSDTCCGTCGGSYSGEEFWIGCDVCERWFHGKCVKITPAKAESIQQYKCPDCNSKKGWR